jgi:hypothetical protein
VIRFLIKVMAVLLLLFWPIAVVVDNIHNTVWDWVVGLPFELVWLVVLTAIWSAVQKSKKNQPAKPSLVSRTPMVRPNVTVVVQSPPQVPCKYCGAGPGRCPHCGAPQSPCPLVAPPPTWLHSPGRLWRQQAATPPPRAVPDHGRHWRQRLRRRPSPVHLTPRSRLCHR